MDNIFSLLEKKCKAKFNGKTGNDLKKYLEEYADPNSERYAYMLEEIRKRQNFTTLRYHRLDDFVASIGIEPCKVCTYCFDGKE